MSSTINQIDYLSVITLLTGLVKPAITRSNKQVGREVVVTMYLECVCFVSFSSQPVQLFLLSVCLYAMKQDFFGLVICKVVCISIYMFEFSLIHCFIRLLMLFSMSHLRHLCRSQCILFYYLFKIKHLCSKTGRSLFYSVFLFNLRRKVVFSRHSYNYK